MTHLFKWHYYYKVVSRITVYFIYSEFTYYPLLFFLLILDNTIELVVSYLVHKYPLLYILGTCYLLFN
jgi:hypothetical protein